MTTHLRNELTYRFDIDVDIQGDGHDKAEGYSTVPTMTQWTVREDDTVCIEIRHTFHMPVIQRRLLVSALKTLSSQKITEVDIQDMTLTFTNGVIEFVLPATMGARRSLSGTLPKEHVHALITLLDF